MLYEVQSHLTPEFLILMDKLFQYLLVKRLCHFVYQFNSKKNYRLVDILKLIKSCFQTEILQHQTTFLNDTHICELFLTYFHTKISHIIIYTMTNNI